MVIKLHIAADRSGGSGESLIYFCIVFADRVEGSAAHIGFHLAVSGIALTARPASVMIGWKRIWSLSVNVSRRALTEFKAQVAA